METKEIQEKARHFLEGERNASGQAGHTEQIEILDYLLTLIRGEQEVVGWVFRDQFDHMDERPRADLWSGDPEPDADMVPLYATEEPEEKTDG